MTKRAIWFACLVLTVHGALGGSINTLSVSYTSERHISIGAGQAEFFRMDTCPEQPPQSYAVVVSLPFEAWNLTGGGPLSVSVYGAENGCVVTGQLGQPALLRPAVVFFATQPNVSSYLLRVHNLQASQPAVCSLSVVVVVDGRPASTQRAVDPPLPAVCPTVARQMQRVVQQIVPQSVPTAAAVQYQFSVCRLHRFRTPVINYVAVAATPSSAFSTYLCRSSPCTPAQSFAADRSGSAFNSLSFSSDNAVIGVYVQGWADYQATSDFVFLFQIVDA